VAMAAVLVVRVSPRLAGESGARAAGSRQCCPAERVHRGRGVGRRCWRLAELRDDELGCWSAGARLDGVGFLAWDGTSLLLLTALHLLQLCIRFT
jgi:hypothetical protein